MAAGRAGRWFLLPGLVFLFAIDLVPLAYSCWVSFYNWWLIRPRDIRFVGLANYTRFADDPEFTRAVVVTTLFTVGAVLVEFLAGLALALLFAQPFKFLRPIRVLLLLPLFAAAVDGASAWQSFRHITVPLLTYIMLLAVLIRGMDAFREFDIIFVLTGGGPGTATQTIQILNYRAFGLGHMGEANAIGIVTLIIVAVMCFV